MVARLDQRAAGEASKSCGVPARPAEVDARALDKVPEAMGHFWEETDDSPS